MESQLVIAQRFKRNLGIVVGAKINKERGVVKTSRLEDFAERAIMVEILRRSALVIPRNSPPSNRF